MVFQKLYNSIKKTSAISSGKAAEKAACYYLKKHGLKLITKNYSKKVGEIDLIMRDKECLVFVEVRLRNPNNLVSAIESVDYYKQKRIIRTANYYLHEKNLMNKILYRFDIVGAQKQNNHYVFEWIKDAFYVE